MPNIYCIKPGTEVYPIRPNPWKQACAKLWTRKEKEGYVKPEAIWYGISSIEIIHPWNTNVLWDIRWLGPDGITPSPWDDDFCAMRTTRDREVWGFLLERRWVRTLSWEEILV
jgi:hypothetical protein